MMLQSDTDLVVELAETKLDLRAAQRLRYAVFVKELGASGSEIDHQNELEMDRFDPFCDHLVLKDKARKNCPFGGIIGVYRLLRSDQAARIGQFYSEDEYDLQRLYATGRNLLELGRSCVHPAYRGGLAMYHLWQALQRYVAEHEVEVLFGVASFHGTDPQKLAEPLSWLHARHLAPEELRVAAKPDAFQAMDLIAPAKIDRRAAMLAMPALIKAYLRLGGYIGEGAFVDFAFKTVDVCLILDRDSISTRQKALYSGDLLKS
jgi:putative hemolysin